MRSIAFESNCEDDSDDGDAQAERRRNQRFANAGGDDGETATAMTAMLWKASRYRLLCRIVR